jgi:hypothetical protein
VSAWSARATVETVPRHNRRRDGAPRPAASAAAQRVDTWRGEDYVVRTVTGASASKPYRCPGCDQLIPLGVPHVVAWPNAALNATDRRHWHTACWAARERRSPRG